MNLRLRLPVILSQRGTIRTGCVGVCTVQAGDEEHPNKHPFKGTLVLLGVASNKPPNGSQGHRILIPKDKAANRLSTLLNMGINYSSRLDRHEPRKKVGVITGAWIRGNQLRVRGYLWKKDFPEVLRDLRGNGLGMSMELADVYVRDKDAPVWILEDFHFSGATVLRQTAAAYTQTHLAAGASSALGVGGETMTKNKKAAATAGKPNPTEKGVALAEAITASIGSSIKEALAPLGDLVSSIKLQGEKLDRVLSGVDQVRANALRASAAVEDEEEDTEEVEASESESDEEEEEEVEAAGFPFGKKDDEEEEEEEEEEDEEESEDEEDEMDEEEDEVDAALAHLAKAAPKEKVGNFNKGAKNKGRKTSLDSSADVFAAAQILANNLKVERKGRKKMQKTIKKLRNTVEAMQAQIDRSAELTERRSVPPELTHLLAKAGHDVDEILASGRKLSISEVDEMFASMPVQLDPTTRMHMKNVLLQKGMMDQGAITRSIQ